jgi:protein required for attachment to host cells
MQTTWIIAADRARARIFEMHGVDTHLEEVEDMINPSGRASNRDLDTDAGGRFAAMGQGERGHTAQPEADAVEHQAELFVKRVSEYLGEAHAEHRYDKLRVIAFPKFLGLMRQHLAPDVKKVLEDEVEKDISWFDKNQIEAWLRNRA